MNALPAYNGLLAEIKDRIQTAQTRAMQAVNAELIQLYWQIGQLLAARQTQEGWGAGGIPRLAQDIRNELPEQKGFSERNLKLMMQLFRTYPRCSFRLRPHWRGRRLLQLGNHRLPQLNDPDVGAIGQPLVARLPWAHNVLLMQMIKDPTE